MPTKVQPEYKFDLSGGILCLDFANTVSRRDDPERRTEHLVSYADLISFAAQSGAIQPKQAQELRAKLRRHDVRAEETLRKGIALRETLFRAFAAIAQHKSAAAGDLQRINDAVLEALQHRRLVRSDGDYRWEWSADATNAVEGILWPVATSAADLLTSEELRALRYCEAPDCEWLFLDHSRNRSRRWCDMKSCGNRQKARRHYRRMHE